MTKDFQLQQEFSRLLTAAVINSRFRQTLLSNPAQAVETGFGGEAFNFAGDVRERVATIRATSLSDFASQLAQL